MNARKIESKRQEEKKILTLMIGIYCRGNHRDKMKIRTNSQGKEVVSLCPECAKLKEYALTRVDRCPMMKTKTFCSACPVHCYRKDRQQEIRKVMRYSGMRIMLYHPIVGLQHIMVTVSAGIKSKWKSKSTKG